ncbi:MAG: hypothetical protein IRZ28_16870 [Steroidobacteraceae bacterium]|nr:hypothetical protein [Steroidobacteraceae bacterium]
MKERKLAAVQAEIAGERAASLAQSAGRLRSALDALKRFDGGVRGRKSRTQLVAEASEACLGYLVQREILGFGAQDAEAIRNEYAVPAEVWNRMGAVTH